MTQARIVGLWVLLLIVFPREAAGYDDPLYQEIASLVSARYGPLYTIQSVYNVDGQVRHSFPYLAVGSFLDPYGTLAGKYVFVAMGTRLNGGLRPRGFLGIYANGVLVALSDTVIVDEGKTDMGVLATGDLNRDGSVDLVVTADQAFSGKGGTQHAWIFSWDEQTLRLISDVDERGESVIAAFSDEFCIDDVDGDGVMEIQGTWSREDDATSSYFTYGWNGQLYGLWPSTPQPGEYDFLPRDRVSVTVGAGVSATSGVYKYSYRVTNSPLSIQAVSEFLVDHLVDTVWGAVAKANWWFVTDGDLLSWVELHRGETTRFIDPGTSDDSMSFHSSDLPTIVKCYVRGYNKEPLNALANPPIDNYGNIFTNSSIGRTIGPALLPTPFNGLTSLDTLKSFVTQSRALNWITTQSIASKYTRLLDTARAHLVANDRGVTKSKLDSVLINVHTDSASTLTSEAYALLRFNTEYLLRKLREEDSTFASANASSSSSATATNNARHLVKSENLLHEVFTSGGTVIYRRSNDGGSTWDQTVQITENADNSHPCITAQHGSLSIVWQRQTGSSAYEVLYSYSGDQGSSWSAPDTLPGASNVQVSQYQTEGPMPVVAPLGTGDNVVAVYCSAQGLGYRTSQDRGSSWQVPQQDIISGEGTGRSQFPSLAGGDSYVSLLYDYSGLDGGPYSRIYDGSSWTKETSVADGTGTSAGPCSSVAIDPAKGPIAAWSGIANSWTHSIIFRMGYSDNTWSNWFEAFGGTQFGPEWFNPSLTYYIPQGGQYGVAIVNHTSSNLIKLIRYFDDGYEAPTWTTTTLSESGKWTGITQENASSGAPVHCWTDQSSFPYSIIVGSSGELSPSKGTRPGTTSSSRLVQKRRAVISLKRLHATFTVDFDPVKIVDANGDTTIVPFKRSRLRDRDSINIVRVWDYLGSDAVQLPSNARRLVMSKQVNERGPSIGRRSFSFRLLNGNGTPIALLDTTTNSGTVSVNVEQYAGMSLILRPQVLLSGIDPASVDVCAGDIFTMSDEQMLPPNNRRTKSR